MTPTQTPWDYFCRLTTSVPTLSSLFHDAPLPKSAEDTPLPRMDQGENGATGCGDARGRTLLKSALPRTPTLK